MRPSLPRLDPYCRSMLLDPYPAYREIRDLAPAVWLPKRRLWAIGRHDDVKAALRAPDSLSSGKGVAANALVNRQNPPIVLTSDDPDHQRRRAVLMRPLTMKSVQNLRSDLAERAEAIVSDLLRGDGFDAMTTFAAHLPIGVVAELVGLSERGRRRMLTWASATFDLLGVLNLRSVAALPRVIQLQRYARTIDRSELSPDGWAMALLDAAERGELSPDEARMMIFDYVAPSLDTTILAAGHMLWRLAVTPGAYDTLRAEPDLIPSVVNETVRLASPIRGFTRHAERDFTLGDVTIPQGERILLLFASANRDERHYPDPDAFDIRRVCRDHLGWGHGPHVCVGMHLARLELESLLTALVRSVARIEVGQPTPLLNNVLQGFSRLPARFHPDGGGGAAGAGSRERPGLPGRPAAGSARSNGLGPG